MPHRIAVCSWSLRPNSPTELVRAVRATGVSAVQLALDPIAAGIWKEDETFGRLRDAGIGVVSAMLAPAGEDYSTLETIRATGGLAPEHTYPANLRRARQIADICARHAISLCTFHAGLVPHDPGPRARMISRLAHMVRAFHDPNEGRIIGVAFETGQESPDDQIGVLAELREDLDATHAARAPLGINFDPANIILYGVGEPVAAWGTLAPHVVQVHIKDARCTTTPGTWGAEVPVGSGDVPWAEFLASVHAAHPNVTLVIEREAGDSRVEDVRRALDLVESTLAGSIAPPASRAVADTPAVDPAPRRTSSHG